MKSLLSSALLAVVLLVASCQKQGNGPEEIVNPILDTTRYKVSLDVASFDAQYTNMKLTDLAKDSSLYIRYLFTAVYDSLGRNVSTKEQVRKSIADTSFGKFSYTLQRGQYQVVFIATTDTLAGSRNLIPNKTANIGSLQVNNPLYNYVGLDIFYNKTAFNVGEQDTAINNIQIERLTGKLELKFNDEKKLIDSTYTNVWIKGAPKTFYPGSETFSTPVSDSISMKQLSKASFEAYGFGSAGKILVQVSAYYNPTNTPVNRIINNNIYIYRNKKTVLSGYLLNFATGAGNVGVNTDFDETIYLQF